MLLYQLSVIDGQVAPKTGGSPRMEIYLRPDEAERRHMLEDLGVDQHTLDSAQDPNETPRIEFERNHFSVILKLPQHNEGENDFSFKIGSVGVFLFPPDYILAVTHGDHFPSRRLPGSRDGKTEEKIKSIQEMLLRILSQTIRSFELSLKEISKRRDELKERMSRTTDTKILLHLFTLRESLIYYAEALRGNGYLIERIRAASPKIGFTPENRELLEDYAIENRQFLEEAKLYSQVLSDMMDTWNSIINNNLNVIMKNMNSLVIAISIPTFFTGLGGMSEFTLFVSPYLEWYVSYPLFFGLMAGLSIFLYRLIQRCYRS